MSDKTDLEHVPHPGADDGLHLTATHPRSKAELDVLAAPDAHSFVERTEFHEVVAVDGDCTADERRRRERQTGLDGSALFMLLHANPRIPTTLTLSLLRRSPSVEIIQLSSVTVQTTRALC